MNSTHTLMFGIPVSWWGCRPTTNDVVRNTHRSLTHKESPTFCPRVSLACELLGILRGLEFFAMPHRDVAPVTFWFQIILTYFDIFWCIPARKKWHKGVSLCECQLIFVEFHLGGFLWIACELGCIWTVGNAGPFGTVKAPSFAGRHDCGILWQRRCAKMC